VYALAGDGYPTMETSKCFLCGHCVAACPGGAINHSGFPLDQCPLIDMDHLPNFNSLVNAIKKRRSIRSFKSKPVPHALIEQLLEIASIAPTGHNLQHVDWTVIDSQELIHGLCSRTVDVLAKTATLLKHPVAGLYLGLTEGFAKLAAARKAAETLAALKYKFLAGEDPVFYNAPAVLVAHVPSGTYFGRDDAIHALYNVELAAERLGLGSCQMGYFKIALDRDTSFKADIGIPAGRSPEATLALGYPKIEYLRMIPRRKPSIQWVS
jgi:nitroreductase